MAIKRGYHRQNQYDSVETFKDVDLPPHLDSTILQGLDSVTYDRDCHFMDTSTTSMNDPYHLSTTQNVGRCFGDTALTQAQCESDRNLINEPKKKGCLL